MRNDIKLFVEDVISWLEVKTIVVRSTVYVGFTREMSSKYEKSIVFQPEYYGKTTAHPFADLNSRTWISLGGSREGVKQAIKAYQHVYTSNLEIHIANAEEVEFAKYMENSFLATKVIFCNEMFDIAERLGIDYNAAREIWLADPRIGRSHTFVYEDDRGFGGSCLPKDLSSIIYQAKQAGADSTLLNAVKEKNRILKNSVERIALTITDKQSNCYTFISKNGDIELKIACEFFDVEEPDIGDLLELPRCIIYEDEAFNRSKKIPNKLIVTGSVLSFKKPNNKVTIPQGFNIENDYILLTYKKSNKRILIQRTYG